MDTRRVSVGDNTRVSGRAPAVAPGVGPEPFCLSAQEFQLLSFSRLQVCVKKPKAANVSPLVCRGKFSSLPGSRCNMMEEERNRMVIRLDFIITGEMKQFLFPLYICE